MFTKTGSVIATSAAVAVLMGFAAPLHAQRRGGGQEGGGSGTARARQRSEQPAPQPQRQEAPSRPQAPARTEAPRTTERNVPRSRTTDDRSRPDPRVENGPRPGARPEASRPDPRVDDQSRTNRRYDAPVRPAPRVDDRSRPDARSGNYAVPRPYGQPPRVTSSRNYGYGSYGRPYTSRRPVFTQRYYTFRPRLTFGFGLSVGYGVAYPFQYYDPYASYNFGIGVRPGYGASYYTSRVGGLSFEIDPWDAEVFIDGQYVGLADDFAPDQMPLTLSAGVHRIELRANGFMPAAFDITVIGGQVLPYQGSLSYAYGR